MENFEMDFEWPVAKYEIAPERDVVATGGILVGFNYTKPAALIAQGEAVSRRPPVRALDFAVRALAIPEPQSFERTVLKVAGSLGMLFGQSVDGEEEKLEAWQKVAGWVQVVFEADRGLRRLPSIQVGQVGLFLESSKIVIRPTTMRDALVFHACRQAASGTHLSPCQSCGTPFLSGGARGKGKKIASSKFCCDQCRWDFNNKQRRQG